MAFKIESGFLSKLAATSEQRTMKAQMNRARREAKLSEIEGRKQLVDRHVEAFGKSGFDAGEVRGAIETSKSLHSDFNNFSRIKQQGVITDNMFRNRAVREFADHPNASNFEITERAKVLRNDHNASAAEARRGASEALSSAQPDGPSTPSMTEARMRKGGKDFSSQYNYVKNQQGMNYDYDNIMKGHTDSASAHQQISKLTGKSMDEVGNMSQDSLKSELGAALHRRSSNANIMDKIGYHKVPQTAVGVGATAFLVSKMAESKGQMSNSQLYGQASPYGS